MAAKPAAKPSRGKGTKASRAAKGTPGTKRVTAKAKAAVSKRADREAAKAKAAGAIGRGLDRHRRALRDTAIMARVWEERPVKSIATEFGVSVRTVESVKDDWSKRGKQLDKEPMELVEWLTSMHFRQFGDLTAMAEATATLNPSVSLGAKKAAGDALLRYTEMLSLVGKLPENLELFRAETVLRRLADEMVTTMERVQAGEITPAEAADVFRSMTTPTAPTRLVAA